jgi:hypothetical protein
MLVKAQQVIDYGTGSASSLFSDNSTGSLLPVVGF